MADYNDIPLGLRVSTQIPLDVKGYATNEASLVDLGPSNQLAYTYVKGGEFYCVQEATRWAWDQVPPGLENTGLIPLDFIYPPGVTVFGIDYSNKRYNFFPVITKGVTLQAGSNVTISGTGNPYVISSLRTYVVSGTNTTITGLGTQPSPYSISSVNTTYTAGPGLTLNGTTFNVVNLQKVITGLGPYVLTAADNNYTIIINNGANVFAIVVPNGLPENFFVGFIQKGTGDVSFVASSTVIQNPIGLKSKGQYYNTALEQEASTNLFYLLGNTKA